MSGRLASRKQSRHTLAAWAMTGLLSGVPLWNAGCADTNAPMVVRHKAMLTEQRGERETALKIREKFIQDNPDYYFINEVYFEQGMTYLSLNQPEKAIEYFDLAIEDDPEYLQAFIRRCQTNSQLGRHEAAIADGNRAMELSLTDRDLARVFLYQGNSQSELQRTGRAIVKWQMALQLDPDQLPALQRLFDAYMEIDQTQEALQTIEDSIKHNPRFAEKQLMYSRVLARLDRREEAAAALEKAYEFNIGDKIELPDSVDDLFSTAVIEVAPLMHMAARPVTPATPTPEAAAVPPAPSTPAPSTPAPAVTAAVTAPFEQTALEIAREYLTEQGFDVLPEPGSHAHMLVCKQGEQTFEVLVKVLAEAGKPEFAVTQAELQLITATTPPRGMLLVAPLNIDRDDTAGKQSTPAPTELGRVTAFARSWRPDPERLTPLTYSYSLPQPAAARPE